MGYTVWVTQSGLRSVGHAVWVTGITSFSSMVIFWKWSLKSISCFSLSSVKLVRKVSSI